MIVEPEATVTASTTAVPLHNPAGDAGRYSMTIRNTSANAATITVGGVVLGAGALPVSRSYPLAGSASLTVSGLTIGETVTAVRTGASDATLSVTRTYGR
jgi:hypothetical protein